MRVSFEKIYLAKYKLAINPEEVLFLPPYKGSTLRGGFGSVFRRISCIDRDHSSCKECMLKDKCAYSYIFETSPYSGSPLLKNLEDIPRPFIIEPPLDNRTTIKQDETLDFNLTLIGRAIDYLPFFIVTFKDLGKTGIGKFRKKFNLQDIRADFVRVPDQALIYSSRDETVRNIDSRFTWSDIIENRMNKSLNSKAKSKFITLKFLTPTRLKYQDEFVDLPEFHVVFRALLRRISNLAYFHCGEELGLDFKALIYRAKKIKIEKINTRWVDWERYSSAQGRRMKLGGIIGEVTYKGEFGAFLPFLLLGQYTHLGKGATFGMGWYEMSIA